MKTWTWQNGFSTFITYRSDGKPIPPLATRRLLIVVISTLMTAAFAVGLTGSKYVVFNIFWMPVYLWFARRATRNMALIDPAPLDEHQRDQVLRANHIAFKIVTGVVLLSGLTLANLTEFVFKTGTVALTQVSWPLLLAGVYIVPWIPVAVLGWRLSDEEPELDDAPGPPAVGGVTRT